MQWRRDTIVVNASDLSELHVVNHHTILDNKLCVSDQFKAAAQLMRLHITR